MFASPIKQSTTNGRRMLSVQTMGNEEYDRLTNFPSRGLANRSSPLEQFSMPAPITKEEVGIRPLQRPPANPAPPERRPLLEVAPYARLTQERSRAAQKALEQLDSRQLQRTERYAQLSPEPRLSLAPAPQPRPRVSAEKRQVNYGILDSFKKARNEKDNLSYINDENDNTPSRVNPMDSPRGLPTKELFVPPPQPVPQPVQRPAENLLAHCLLAFEVSRLMEVVKDYENSMQKAGQALEDLGYESDQLKQDRSALHARIADLERRLAEKPPPVRQIVHVPAPAPPPQPPQIIHVRQAEPSPPPRNPDHITINITDYLNDDKNSLIQLLVKRNLENDQLRKELDALKNGSGLPVAAQPTQDRDRDKQMTRDLLLKFGQVMRSMQTAAPDLSTNRDFELLKLRLDSLANKLDNLSLAQPSAPAKQDSYFNAPGMLADSIRSLHHKGKLETPQQADFEREKEQVFGSIMDVFNKVLYQGKPPGSGFDQSGARPAPSRTGFDERTNSDLISRLAIPPLNHYPDLREDLARAQKRISELESAVSRGSHSDPQEVFRLTRLIEEYKDRLAESERENEEWTARLRQDIHEANMKKDSEEKETAKALKRAQSRIAELELSLRSSESLLESLREQLEEKDNRTSELETTISKSEEELRSLKSKVSKLEDDVRTRSQELSTAQEKLGQREKDVKTLQENERILNEELSELDSTLLFLKNKAEELGRNLTKTEEDLLDSQSKTSSLEKENRSLDKSNQDLKVQVRKLQTQIRRTRDVLENLHTVSDRISDLKREQARTRSTIKEEITNCKQIVNIMRSLMQEQGELNPKGTLVTLMALKDKQSVEIPRLQMKLTNVQDLINSKDSELVQLESQMASDIRLKKTRIEELERKLRDATGEVERQTQRVREEEERLSKEKEETSRLKKELQDNQVFKQKVLSEIDEIKKDHQQLEAAFSDSQKENKKLKKVIDGRDQELLEARNELDSKLSVIEELQKSLKTSQQKLSSMAVASLSTPVQQKYTENTRESTGELRSSREASMGRSKFKGIDLYVDPYEKHVLIEENDKFDSNIVGLMKELDEANERIRHLERALHNGQDQQQKLVQLGEHIRSLEFRIENLSKASEVKDQEIQSLRKSQSSVALSAQAQEDQDKIETLRHRTEAMLTKLERKLAELAAARGPNLRRLEEMAEECRSLRKKLADSNKKYINDYINVCQRSIDMYVEVQS